MATISSADIVVRPATIEDADALSKLEILARPADPSWTFRFPYRDQYPEDHQIFNRAKYNLFCNSGGSFEVTLAEIPSPNDLGTRTPIGVSIWDMRKAPWYTTEEGSTTDVQTTRGSGKRRDEHPARHAKIVEVHSAAHDVFFSSTFGVDKHLYLMILAVHPDYQRLGIATTLCRWGIDRAAQYPGCQVGVTTSQMDSERRLYDGRLGFRSLGAAVCWADDDVVEGQNEVRMEFLIWGSTSKIA
ncbi:MAG: hypothetical protein M1820_006345 [Bogoriella megaspora]|nr:MAG: hypothetical protein M1820_006345 [Bogoriella megaspora]